MKKSILKVFSIILIALMVLSSIPMTSLAVNVLCVAGHKWGTYTVTKAATCIAQGEKKAICERSGCDAVDTQPVAINPQAHKPVNMPRVEATCDKYGNEAGVICGYCGIKISGYAPIAPKNHKSTTLAAKAATCTEDGNKAGTKCETCGITLTGGEVIKKTDHRWELYSKVPATCTTKGSQVDICLNCGIKSAPKEIEASHSWGVWLTVVAATCFAQGKMVRKCTVAGCNAEEVKPIEKIPHTYTWKVTTDPTCSQPGVKEGTCTICSNKTKEPVDKIAHATVDIPAVAPTCTETGSTAGKKCIVCDSVTNPATVVPALGHIVNDPFSWKTEKYATCTEAGKRSAKCSRCNATVTEITPALGHKEVIIPAVAPTCTDAGTTAGKICKVCGTNIEGIFFVPALGHDFSIDKEFVDATCTETGLDKGKCSRCDAVKNEVIPAKGHTEEILPGSAPTCEEPGIKEGKWCITCYMFLVEQEYIPALGHDFSRLVITTEPTCNTKGLIKIYCNTCDESYGEYVLSELGHKYNADWQTVVAPTCTKEGIAIRICVTCQNIESKTVSAISHTDSDSDNNCDYGCGYVFQQPTPEKELNFFQKIAEWFRNLFDKLFGWLKF